MNRRQKNLCLCVLTMFCVVGLAGKTPEKNFLEKTSNRSWNLTEYASWTRLPDGETALRIRIAPQDPIRDFTYGAHLKLDLSRYKGKQIVISANISAKNVPSNPKSHCCVKLMLMHRDNAGIRYTASSTGLWGTFENRREELGFFVSDPVGENTLLVGIQNNRGEVLVSGLKIEEQDLYPPPVPVPENFRCEYSDELRSLPPLRGAGLPSISSLQDARDLAKEGANLIRWWIRWDPEKPETLDRALDRLEAFLPEYRKLHIKLIPVLNSIPGGRYHKPVRLGINPDNAKGRSLNNYRLFFEKQYLDEYLNVWKKIARRFKGSPVIHGYSVMNEPSQSGRVVYDYLLCQYLAAKAIREIDPDIPVFIAANNWDKPDAFPYLKPLPLKNIYYEVHMYDPYAYTHQGVGTTIENIKKGKYFVYPGKIGGSFYNRATLRNILQPVVDFQKKYGAKIYCGEFSVIRWAPGAAQYLEDLCSIFEELGWDWAYHCYREWENWSFEYPDSFQEKTPAKSPTARHLVLRKYWKRNASPYTGRK